MNELKRENLIAERIQPGFEYADSDAADDGSGTAVIEVEAPPKPRRAKKRQTDTKEVVETLPPWRVLLHNDDVNDMEYVAMTISELTPLSFKFAIHCMLEAHLRGLTLLLVTHQERAELYQEQFQSKQLTVTIEPVENLAEAIGFFVDTKFNEPVMPSAA